jgi:hypothetical protein
MKLTKPEADLYVPDGRPPDDALARATHLAVGAHQDDLEFMALHGILECFGRPDRSFAGVTMTNGAAARDRSLCRMLEPGDGAGSRGRAAQGCPHRRLRLRSSLY